MARPSKSNAGRLNLWKLAEAACYICVLHSCRRRRELRADDVSTALTSPFTFIHREQEAYDSQSLELSGALELFVGLAAFCTDLYAALPTALCSKLVWRCSAWGGVRGGEGRAGGTHTCALNGGASSLVE
eukprot:285765-Chlamydomonas_euryale.AAC.2